MITTDYLRRQAEKITGEGVGFEHRISDFARNRPRSAKIISNIRLLWRMVGAWRQGQYQPRRRSLLIAVLALGYFLNPIDLIPDFIPVIGWLDDVGVYLLAMALLAKELKRFEEWEKSIG